MFSGKTRIALVSAAVSGKRSLLQRLAPLCAAALVVGSLPLSALSARADDYVPGTSIYVIDANGATDVTATYSETDHAILYNGTLIPVVLDYQGGHVTDLQGNAIGFVG